MSRLAELIDELCPGGVARARFSDVCDYVRGVTYKKNQEVTSCALDGIKLLRANNITVGSNTLNSDDVKIVSSEVKVSERQKLSAGDILICAGSGSREHVGKVAFIDEDMPYTFGGFMAVIRTSEELYPRYFYHVLSSSLFKSYLQTALTSTTINNLSARIMANFTFPLPPLVVQQEIVRVLDAFTDLEQSLVSELDLRSKQYDYYRRELLDFDDSVERFPLAELAEYVNGKAHERLVSEDGTIPLVTARFISRNGEANRYVKLEDIQTPAQLGDIAMVLSDLPNGRALARTFFVDCDDSYAINQRVARIRVLDFKQIEPRFLYYVLDRNPGLLKYDSGFDQTHLSKRQVTSLMIPLPSLGIQREIVERLDKFSALVNDMSSGIPAEITLRRKQYEFYRDELLAFTPKGA